MFFASGPALREYENLRRIFTRFTHLNCDLIWDGKSNSAITCEFAKILLCNYGEHSRGIFYTELRAEFIKSIYKLKIMIS